MANKINHQCKGVLKYGRRKWCGRIGFSGKHPREVAEEFDAALETVGVRLWIPGVIYRNSRRHCQSHSIDKTLSRRFERRAAGQRFSRYFRMKGKPTLTDQRVR